MGDFSEEDDLNPTAILKDSVEILNAVLEEHEEVLGEVDDVLRDLLRRVKGAISTPPEDSIVAMMNALDIDDRGAATGLLRDLQKLGFTLTRIQPNE